MLPMSKAHLTAMIRSKPSAPMRYLASKKLLKGHTLDFGCGHGFDALYYGMDRYDPHYFPVMPSDDYDTITCNYVLNVVKRNEATKILNIIRSYLRPGGVAYVAVRRDVKKAGVTSKGTYQRNVKLDLPVVKENTRYCIYKVTKGD